MKTINLVKGRLVKLLFAVVTLFVATSAHGQEIDLGELELGKQYELTMYKGCKATFTAPETGVLVASCTRSYWPEPYLDAEHTKPVSYRHSYVNGGSVWEFNVQAGVTYYFYHDFLFDGGTFSIDYAATELKRKSMNPAMDSALDIGGVGQVHIEYNMNVSVSDVTLTVDGNVLGTGVAYVSGRNASIPFKGETPDELNLIGLLRNGTLKGGEVLEFSFVVTSANDPSLVLNETITYICPEMLSQLVSAQELSEFLSYWFPGEESGKIKLVFDAPLMQTENVDEGTFATIQYGNPESDVEGDCYVEKLPASVDGNIIVVDFTGVRRRANDMLTSGNTYPTMLVKISNVKDENGRYVYTGTSGTLGSFSYEVAFRTIDSEAVYEFTPASGTDLKVSEVELWIQDYSSMRFDGVEYSYVDEDGNQVVQTVALSELNPEVDEYGDAIIMIPVSEELRGKSNLKIALTNLMFIDGVEREISAVYNPVKEDVGIQDVKQTQQSDDEYFTVGGCRTSSPVRGITIVRQTSSNGAVATYKQIGK